jgi:hypothetical protein
MWHRYLCSFPSEIPVKWQGTEKAETQKQGKREWMV